MTHKTFDCEFKLLLARSDDQLEKGHCQGVKLVSKCDSRISRIREKSLTAWKLEGGEERM